MRKLSSFLLFIVCFSLSALSDSASFTALNLLDRNDVYISDADILGFLRTLSGDTITFNITAVNKVDIFKKEQPDTIWITKRPKKNAQEGKHYKLSYIYKGEPTASGEYFTPTSKINGKPFGVLSVDNVNDGNYYSYHNDIILKLIDLEDLSVLNCRIPHNNKFSFAISSNQVDRDIKSITGKYFYVKTGNEYSNPKYTLCTLNGGESSILINNHIGNVEVRVVMKLHFIDKDGLDIPFKPVKPMYSSSFAADLIVSKTEYEDKHTVRTINSDVDFALVDSDKKLPFDFKYILGTCDGHSAYISQNIVPENIKNHSWTSDFNKAPADELMFVGGSLTVRNTKFFKMIYNGKAFFIKADDVKLLQESKLKLDSLENSSDEIKELFWNKTLFINKVLYYNTLNDASKEIYSYSKYGLAIKSWNIYDESEYTEGTGAQISFFNPTEKTIKYISITFQGYNAVDDPFGRPVSKKCVGPIEPKETASYKFEYMWFSDIVKYAKIRSITVTYKNGTTKTISNPTSIILSNKTLKTIFGSNPVEEFK